MNIHRKQSLVADGCAFKDFSIAAHNLAWKTVIYVIGGTFIASFDFPMSHLYREAEAC